MITPNITENVDSNDIIKEAIVAFTIFCPTNWQGKALGDKQVAEYALRSVGRFVNYNPAFNNCHCFTASCLEGKAVFCPSFSVLESLVNEKYGACKWRATVLNH